MDIENTASLKQIYWHQGQFLQPQHLQHSDLWIQSRITTMMKIASPYLYGVSLLDINEEALENDVFEVQNAELLMQDGTFVDYPDDAVLSARNFTSVWIDRTQPLNVFVGIPKMKASGANVSLVQEQAHASEVTTRYLTYAEPELVNNYYHAGEPAQIKKLTYVLKLFWESELEDAHEYELLPIAQIENDGGTNKLSSTFIPPCLHIASSDVLLDHLKGIRDELAGRLRQLEDYKTPIGVSNSNVDSRVVSYRLIIQLLSQYVPLLFHYIDTPRLHPWEIYGSLRQLIGGISTVTHSVNFLGENEAGDSLIPKYQHNELTVGFESIHKLIVQLLNEVTISSETIIRLEEVLQGQYKIEIPATLFNAKNIYLSMITSKKFDEMLENFMNFAKIGSEEQVKVFAERSLPGLEVKFQNIQPEGVPRRPNAYYLKVNKQDSVWDGIKEDKSIMLLWKNAPEDLKVDFIAV